ncbi:MAG TPA: mandelate racemase/muconate lactonizing enzyme family protein [Streptosporangiaceae bacterium]|nr:mandelate racemase/muconate lactonizing enzyme family protein [Streptosporangiaceae bacterium]
MQQRIVRAEAFLCDLPVERPRTDATQSFLKQETIFVQLETGDGNVGTGYTYTIGTGGRSVLELLRHDLLPGLAGSDSGGREAIWARLLAATRATAVGAVTSLALAAVDTAVWDLWCNATGQPLWLAAGGAKPAVPLYDTEGGWLHLSTDEIVANAKRVREAGWSGAKIKIGKPSAHEDVERVAAVRDALGPELDLMVDANQAFTLAEARRRARLLEPYDLCWFEEPLPADDIEGHARLAESTSVPIAVGESLYSLAQFREYLERGAAGIVQVDAARIGGITPWLKVAHLAEACNVQVAPHFLMELHVSLTAAIPNGRCVEFIPQLRAVTTAELSCEKGEAVPPSEPGLGIAWDADAIANYRVA